MGNLELLRAIYRNDFYAFMQKAFYEIDGSQKFVASVYLEVMCNKLQLCAEGVIKRLIINIPPRSLKSHCASIALPAYILGHDPNARIVCVSYAEQIAAGFSRKTRELMNTDFYKKTFATRLGDKNTETEFNTTKNGYRYSTSIGGQLTGFGGNYIIIDDPIKASNATSEAARRRCNEWFDNTLISRLNNKNDGVIILVMQRLHIDDLTSHLLKQGGWELLSLPAIAEEDEKFVLSTGKVITRAKGEVLNPEIDSLDTLLQLQKTMSSYNFSAQYQQNPIPMVGNVINFDDFQTYDSCNLPVHGTTFQSWDIALKDGQNNDYSVCVTAKYDGACLYIVDISRFKLPIYDLAQQISYMYSKLIGSKHLIIEETSISVTLLHYLSREMQIYPIQYKPIDSKIERANNASFYIKAQCVKLPQNATWLDDFRSEINAFPNGRHDDQVDALTQLIDQVLGSRCQYTLLDFAQAMKNSLENSYKYETAKSFCEKARRTYRFSSIKRFF